MAKVKHKKTKVKKRKRKTKRSTRRVIRPARHTSDAGAPRYVLNRDFQFIQELRDLILKSSPAEKSEIAERLQKIGRIKLAVISGVFLNKENPETMATDLFIVADYIDRRKFQAFIKYLEAETGGEVRFVIMEKEEFQYRLSMFDRFVRVLLEGPHEKLINRLGV